jgi:hypothetical protein
LEAKVKGFGIFHDSDARHFLAAVCLVSLFLGGLSACGTLPKTKEIRIEVSQPEGKQSMNGNEWLLIMVQRRLTDQLNKVSSTVTAERDPRTPPEYRLTGSLAVTAPDIFVLEFKIADKEGKIEASYTSTDCALADLKDLSALKKAALELLKQMDVKPEHQAAVPDRQVKDAEIALYKGIAADRRSTDAKTTSEAKARATVEALYYYNEATTLLDEVKMPLDDGSKTLDPDATILQEATDGFNVVLDKMKAPPPILSPKRKEAAMNPEKTVTATRDAWNSFKADRETQRRFLVEQDNYKKNLLQKHKELTAYLTACMDFYRDHPPFKLYYDDFNLERAGDIDYVNGTADIKFRISMAPVRWKMTPLEIIISELNSVKTTMRVMGVVEDKNLSSAAWPGLVFNVDAELSNGKNEVIGSTAIPFNNLILDGPMFKPARMDKSAVFSRIKIDNITDTLKVKIRRVNGTDTDVNKKHIDIVEENFNDTNASSAGSSSGQSEQVHGNTARGQNDYGLADDASNNCIEEEHDRWV